MEVLEMSLERLSEGCGSANGPLVTGNGVREPDTDAASCGLAVKVVYGTICGRDARTS